MRQATAAFHDVDQAIAAGYASPVGGHCEETAAGAMGVHSVNAALMQTPALIPEQPEVLLYLPSGSGNYRLVGVEYVQTLLLRNTQTGQVAPWFSPGPWPAGYVIVNPTPSLFGQSFQGPMAGHVPGMPWHYDLHVWRGHPIRAACSRNGTRRSAAIKARQFRNRPRAGESARYAVVSKFARRSRVSY